MPKQAKTITPQDMRRLLDFVAANKHHVRNRTMLLATQLAGMRVGEVASLRYGDVYTAEGAVRDQINLIPEQTKGRHARAVFVNAWLKREFEAYLASHPMHNTEDRLFYTQKKGRAGFTPNTLAQYFHYLYKRAGIAGTSNSGVRRMTYQVNKDSYYIRNFIAKSKKSIFLVYLKLLKIQRLVQKIHLQPVEDDLCG